MIQNVSDILKIFKPDVDDSAPRRLARFLDVVADKLPGTYVPRNVAAKIAFALSKTPSVDSKDVKRLRNIVHRTNEILIEDFNRELRTDKVDGIRAIHSETDRVLGPARAKRTGLDSRQKSYEDCLSRVDLDKIPDPVVRKEAENQIKSATKYLSPFRQNIPLLPPLNPIAKPKPRKP